MTQTLSADEADLTLRPLGLEAILLSDEEITAAAESAASESDPERAWTRYLRALAVTALRKELRSRKAEVVVGPELEPEAPDRLLALNGLASQLLCVSPLAETVSIPLAHWRQTTTAPQLLLLAQVDEDQGVVQFPGVLAAAAFLAEVRGMKAASQEEIELPLERFGGGLERLLRWITLLESEALPRLGLAGPAVDRGAGIEGLRQWLEQWLANRPALVPLPVTGTRSGEAATVQLITPEVEIAPDGTAMATAVCGTPSIWATTPLAEILIEQEGTAVWQKLATRRQPIEGPISWPLEPLHPEQRVTIRMRPYGATGGAYAVLTLIAPDAAALERGEEAIRKQLNESQMMDFDAEDRALASDVQARLWLALNGKGEGGIG